MKVTNLARTCVLNLMALAAVVSVSLPRAGVAADGESIIECHNFTSAVHLCDALAGCDRDYKIQRRYFDAAMTCIMNWLDCDLYQRIGSPKFADCGPRAIERCDRVFADMDFYLMAEGKAEFQRSRIPLYCGGDPPALDFQTEFLGDAPMGLDYGDNLGTCDDLGLPLQSLDDWITCGDMYQARLYAEFLTLVAPRAFEFLFDNGFCNLFPEQVYPEASPVCNSALGPPPPLGGGAPEGPTGQIRKCQKKLHIGLKQYLHRHLTDLESCTEDYMRCELKQTYGLFSANGYQQCKDKAQSWCERVRLTRDVMIVRSVARIKTGCRNITFADMAGILGFSDIAAACPDPAPGNPVDTVDEVIDCLLPKVKCIAWNSERFVEARMDEDAPAAHLADYYATCGSQP
jgi:hypothetical protein